jgi:hypothetical protein
VHRLIAKKPRLPAVTVEFCQKLRRKRCLTARFRRRLQNKIVMVFYTAYNRLAATLLVNRGRIVVAAQGHSETTIRVAMRDTEKNPDYMAGDESPSVLESRLADFCGD